jgi:hypothetical protein
MPINLTIVYEGQRRIGFGLCLGHHGHMPYSCSCPLFCLSFRSSSTVCKQHDREQALQIAESGVHFYKWYLGASVRRTDGEPKYRLSGLRGPRLASLAAYTRKLWEWPVFCDRLYATCTLRFDYCTPSLQCGCHDCQSWV